MMRRLLPFLGLVAVVGAVAFIDILPWWGIVALAALAWGTWLTFVRGSRA